MRKFLKSGNEQSNVADFKIQVKMRVTTRLNMIYIRFQRVCAEENRTDAIFGFFH